MKSKATVVGSRGLRTSASGVSVAVGGRGSGVAVGAGVAVDVGSSVEALGVGAPMRPQPATRIVLITPLRISFTIKFWF
jgi:hypothetical protein